MTEKLEILDLVDGKGYEGKSRDSVKIDEKTVVFNKEEPVDFFNINKENTEVEVEEEPSVEDTKQEQSVEEVELEVNSLETIKDKETEVLYVKSILRIMTGLQDVTKHSLKYSNNLEIKKKDLVNNPEEFIELITEDINVKVKELKTTIVFIVN